MLSKPLLLWSDGRVEAASCVAIEDLETNCRIIDAGREAEERIFTFSGVLEEIASVRWWVDRLRCRRKRKKDEREWNE